MMSKSLFPFFLLALLVLPKGLIAQQTSKAKSKEKLYEKTGENKHVKIRNAANINTSSDEFGTAFYKDGIVFAASKGKATAKFTPTTDLYFSPFDPNLEPRKSGKFSVELNSRRNEGAATFSRDMKTMYFTQNNIVDGVEIKSRDNVLHLKIFETRFGTNDWMAKKELSFNSDQYSCMHPSLSRDDSTLYFASDMKGNGGQGGMDIYKVTRKNGQWGNAINMGKEINTEKNEIFPFIYPSGDLYFASSGHDGLGGYDIYQVNKEGVVNIGQPFNSPQDDFGLILNDDGTRGFFTSNRKGGFGQDDIYTFEVQSTMPGMAPIEAKQKIIIVTQKDGTPIPKAELRIISMNEIMSGTDKDLYRSRVEPIDKGKNQLRMTLVRRGGEELGEPDAYTNAQGEARFDFKPYTEYLIFANTDDLATQINYHIKPEETDDKIALVLNKPATKVLDGVLLNQGGRKINAAILTFTNKETWDQDQISTDANGKFAIAIEKGQYWVRVTRPGFKPQYKEVEFDPATSTFKEFRMEHFTDGANMLDVIGEIKQGVVIKLDKIEYDLNKDHMNKAAQINLKHIIAIMNDHPNMVIEINSHTDAQGNATANLELSQRRSSSVKDFLVVEGKISPSRIIAIGQGETKLLNHCKDGINCADQEHAVNRRTEVIVKSL
jgi:outer membrane protein OmpA-like peptidoglycan-associated protein